MKKIISISLVISFFSMKLVSQILYGIDVSHYQSPISSSQWSQVIAYPKYFSFVKCSEGYTGPDDTYFQSNMTNGGNAGLKMGAYHLAWPQNNSATNEANHFLSLAANYIGSGYLPPALDMEPARIDAYMNQGHTWSDVATWIQAWSTQVYNYNNNQRWPVLYLTGYYANKLAPYYGNTINSNIKLWFADYPNSNPGNPSVPNGWPWLFEQYSETGSLAGMNPVDLNVFNGTLTDFNNLIGGGSVVTTPTNDECSNAQSITVSSTSLCSGATTGNITNATQSIIPISCGGYTSTMCNDVWYKFIASSTSHIITVVPSSGLDAVVDLRTGSCNGSNISCSDNGGGAGGTETINATGLTVGATYSVRVYDYTGSSTPASTTSFTICVSTPSIACNPVSISVHPINQYITSGNAISLTVIASGTSPVYQWYLNGSPINGANSPTYNSPILTSTDNGNYYYCIISNCNGSQATSNSAYITVNTSACTTAPSIPNNLSVSLIGSNQSHLSWSGTNLNVSTFEVERATSNSGTFIKISSTGTIMDFTDITGIPGTTYYYRVRACCNSTCSDYSNVTSIMASTFSTPPTDVSTSNDNICVGDSVVLTVNGGSLGTGAVWTWRLNQSILGYGNTITIKPIISGTYVVKPEGGLTFVYGASKIITVNSLPPVPTITLNNKFLISSSVSNNQWYLNGNILSSEISQFHIPITNGNYTVCVSDANGCSSCSSVYNYLTIGADVLNDDQSIKIIPNPTNGKFRVESLLELSKIVIINGIGSLIFEMENCKTEIDLSIQPKGVYYIQIKSKEKTFVEKVIIK